MGKLGSQNAFLKIKFSYFIDKTSPISKKKSFLEYKVYYIVKIIKNKKVCKLKIKIPVMTSCPCSKAISIYGAHNQRSIVTVCFKVEKDVSLNEIISIVERNASCDIYSLIKRKDEKYMTEKSYENSKFVEDFSSGNASPRAPFSQRE